MPGEDDIDTLVIEQRPDIVEPGVVPVLTFTEPRVMEDRDGARRSVCLKILRQPLVLRRTRRVAVVPVVRIETDDVPTSSIHGVVVRSVVPVVGIAGSPRREVPLMVAGDGIRDPFSRPNNVFWSPYQFRNSVGLPSS